MKTPKATSGFLLLILVPEAEEAIKSQLELRKIIVEPIQEDIKGEFENLLFVNTKGKPVNVELLFTHTVWTVTMSIQTEKADNKSIE